MTPVRFSHLEINLCARKHRADALLSAHNGARALAQNGEREVTKPLVRARCGKAKRKRHGGYRRR